MPNPAAEAASHVKSLIRLAQRALLLTSSGAPHGSPAAIFGVISSRTEAHA
jgi:hypothetical protein